MFDIVEEIRVGLAHLLVGALKAAGEKNMIKVDRVPDFTVEVPREKEHGDFATNLAMFVPLGLLIPLSWSRLNWRDVTVVAFLISAAVEIFQGVLLPHRSAEFADVVANTLGCAVGAVLVAILPGQRKR